MSRLLAWWRWRRLQQYCPHERLRGIYGDEVNACLGFRLTCRRCHALLDGPVSLAAERP